MITQSPRKKRIKKKHIVNDISYVIMQILGSVINYINKRFNKSKMKSPVLDAETLGDTEFLE